MKSLRVAIRIPALILATAVLFLLWLIGRYLTARFKRVRRRWQRVLLSAWGRSVAAIMGMRIVTVGESPLPPFFLVSNHLSYVDIVAYAACLGCVFISRGDIADWPGIGMLARGVGTIFINREKLQDIPRVIGEINQSLDEGLGVVLFPEGVSGAGDRVLPFHPSLLDPAAKANYPVSYATITYRTEPDETPAYLAVNWWENVTFAQHARELLKLSRFEAFITFGSHAIRSDDRKALARSLRSAVNDQFVPMVDSTLLNSKTDS
ncbi:MAG TPA: 1-acyl-sn-glycerol-3-phosphate acyltransferase [Blastocatellia bacterium]|nr:1-acyl-sn-glycerol-3-phosphate acyltransferase [Blastocatellia bacterium]